MEYLKIGEIRFNSYAREGLLARFQDDIPYVIPIFDFPSNPMGYKIRDGWPSSVVRHTFFSASNFAIALDLFRNGQTAIYIPDLFAKKENQCFKENRLFVKIKEHKKATSKRELFLVKLKIVPESSEIKKVTKVFRRLCS